jgi:hypothetical protein
MMTKRCPAGHERKGKKCVPKYWVDKLSPKGQRKAYQNYLQAKRDIDEPSTISFGSWKKMERAFAKAEED